ncbi:MAG: hypothetical protein J6J79_09840 [Lachnospiraceae bacterium]|nr:hypothetical protein [Lachnospiraceae bacterium]
MKNTNKKRIKIQKADFYDKLFNDIIRKNLEPFYELEFSDQPDFLFYSVYDTGIEHFKYENCVKIFYAAEGVLPDFNECDYAIGSYPMEVGDRYLREKYNAIPDIIQDRKRFEHVNLKERRFCNFIYSNATNGRGAVLRQEFCKKLMEYKRVDCPGNVLNNMKDAIEPRNGKWYPAKIEFIKDYKFTIAFENVAMAGMTTEKLIQPFEAGSIPIYWGDPAVTEIFNNKAFINCRDFSSWEEVIAKVVELDNDDDKYMEMLMEQPLLEDVKTLNTHENIRNFLCKIVEKGNVQYEKCPLGFNVKKELYSEHVAINKGLCGKLHNKKKEINGMWEKGYNKIVKVSKQIKKGKE